MTAYRQHNNPRYTKRNRKDRSAQAPRPRHINLEAAGWQVGLDSRHSIQTTYRWLGVTVKTWMSFDGRRKIAHSTREIAVPNDNAVHITHQARQLICQILAERGLKQWTMDNG